MLLPRRLTAPLLLAGLLLPPPPLAGELPALAPAVEAATLEAHVRFLAADELQGRMTGTQGTALAARYLAHVLEAQGLAPAVGDGFLQEVPLGRPVIRGAPQLAWRDAAGAEHAAAAGVDFEVLEGLGSTGWLELVEVEAGAEVEPDEGAALLLADRGELRRLQQAAPAGSAAPGLFVLSGSPRPGRAWSAGAPGRLQRLVEERARPAVLRVRGDLLARVEAGDVRAVRLVQLAEMEPVSDHNVIGWIRGVGTPERPELAREVVVLTAHFDHIGVDEGLRARALDSDAPEELDHVFNGADDDASGVAAVLEIAHALAAGEPPARSVLVLLVTGEEQGLLGTWHYLDDPLAPLERTVANVNFEMLGRPDPLVGGAGALWLTGPERTNLMQAFLEAQLRIVPDPRPEQRFFVRSDNIAFAVRGVVAQTLSSYNMHADYHRVTDTADRLDYAHMQSAVAEALAAVELLTSGRLDPAWLPGGMPAQR